MAKVEIENPKVITFSFRQEKGDPDYGTCLWARFHFDTQAYTMFVESDCGSYSYGWVPTPNSETFLHLMARCEGEYILGKIASQSELGREAIHRNIVDKLTAEFSEDDLSDTEWEAIRHCCMVNDPADIIEGVYDILDCTVAEAPRDEYGFWEDIEYDYPASAKKIAEIFEKHIRPAIQEMRKEHG